ncbi:MAG: TonB-dependent receptor [Pelobium sp.]
MKHKLLLFILLMSTYFGATAQEKIKIFGKVTTSDGQPAANISVMLKGTSYGTYTDDLGKYQLRNIKPGAYTLKLSAVGIDPQEKSIILIAGEQKELDFSMNKNSSRLQEVVVIGSTKKYNEELPSASLRINEPLLEVPQNIQVVTAAALADQQIISMSDGLIRNVSGVTRTEHWGDMYTNLSMRGSQIQAFRNGFNVVNSSWGPLTEDMSFVDHIEFVKGPAGFMLASGDPSGLYNVVTKKPTGQSKAEATFTLGSYDLYRTTLDLDGKLSKDSKLLYRFNVAGQNKGSFRANEYNNRFSIAPVISYQIDENTKLTAEYTLQHANMSDVGSFYVFSPDGYATLPRDFTSLSAGMPATVINDHSTFINLQHQISKSWKLTAQGSYFYNKQLGSDLWPNAVNADGTMLRSVSGWDAKSTMTMGQVFLNGDVKTGNIRHRILGGLDVGNKSYFADWSQTHQLDTLGGEFDPHNPYLGSPNNGYPAFDYSTDVESRATAIGGTMMQRYTAIYVQDELGFLQNRFRLTLAGRYTDFSQANFGGKAEKATHFSPRVGLSYSVGSQTSFYGLYDQAFIPQNGILANGNSTKPITGNNLEFGIKKEWFNHKWNTTVSAYRILKNNELTADPNSPPTANLSVELGQKRAQGIEFDIKGNIFKGFNLIANYALTDSKVTKVTEGITGIAVGDVVPGYAKHTVNSWLNYKIQEGILTGFGISGGFTWLAGRETDSWSESDIRLPNYFKLDAGLSWQKGNMNITANAFNVLDKYLYSGSYYSYLNAFYWQTETPRNYRLSIGYKF